MKVDIRKLENGRLAMLLPKNAKDCEIRAIKCAIKPLGHYLTVNGRQAFILADTSPLNGFIN